MKEIETIINKYACYNDGCVKKMVKALEQYVIKARIEELESIGFGIADEYLMKRIAELKNGLEGK